MSRWPAIIATVTFLAVFALHFGVLTWRRSQVAAQWVQLSQAAKTSALSQYIERGEYWLGYSYALAAAFTAFAIALTVRRRRQAASGVVGGVTLIGVLYGAGCFLIGCCGSPMLTVYLSLFGASILGLLKPLVAGITTVTVVVSGILILRRARASECATCQPAPTRGAN